MTEENKVFKLVGPALVPVDLQEARMNVGKRLEFIEAEIKKVDGQIETSTASQNALAEEVSCQTSSEEGDF